MSIRDVIAKVRQGTPLNALESAELEAFDPDALQERLRRAESQLEAAENSRLSSEDLLKKQLAEAVAQRDAARSEHQTFLRKRQLGELAREQGFTDPEYLDYLSGKDHLDLNDPDAVSGFFSRLRERMPSGFLAPLKSGSAGTPGGNATGSAAASDAAADDPIGILAGKIAAAPAM